MGFFGGNFGVLFFWGVLWCGVVGFGFFVVRFVFVFFFFSEEECLQGQVLRRAQKCDMAKNHSCGQKLVLILRFLHCCMALSSKVFTSVAYSKTLPLYQNILWCPVFPLLLASLWVHNSM